MSFCLHLQINCVHLHVTKVCAQFNFCVVVVAGSTNNNKNFVISKKVRAAWCISCGHKMDVTSLTQF